MFGASFRNQVRGAAKRFTAAEEGNIAVIFAIALVPILGFVGAAVDYTRANSARSSMQIPAAKNLIDQLKASASNAGDVYISIVPFSRDVNVGASNYNQAGSIFRIGTAQTRPATGAISTGETGATAEVVRLPNTAPGMAA
jgi:hypothetical protein